MFDVLAPAIHFREMRLFNRYLNGCRPSAIPECLLHLRRKTRPLRQALQGVKLYVYMRMWQEAGNKGGSGGSCARVGGGGANERFHWGYMRNLGSHAEEAADRNTRSESETAGKRASLCAASADSRFNFLLSDKWGVRCSLRSASKQQNTFRETNLLALFRKAGWEIYL